MLEIYRYIYRIIYIKFVFQRQVPFCVQQGESALDVARRKGATDIVEIILSQSKVSVHCFLEIETRNVII